MLWRSLRGRADCRTPQPASFRAAQPFICCTCASKGDFAGFKRKWKFKKKNSTVELYMPNYVYFKACLVCQETVSITAMETPKLVIILRGKKGHRYLWEGKVSSRHLVLWMPLSLCCVFFLVLPGTCLRALDSRCYIPRSRKQDSAQKNLFETLRVQGRKTSGSI